MTLPELGVAAVALLLLGGCGGVAPVVAPPHPPPPTERATPTAVGDKARQFLEAVAEAESFVQDADFRAAGEPFAATFQEGQTLEQPVVLRPGGCYLIMAARGTPPLELRMQLVGEIALEAPPAVLADATGAARVTKLGGRATGCFKAASPLRSAKVILKALHGAGDVTAQVFVRVE